MSLHVTPKPNKSDSNAASYRLAFILLTCSLPALVTSHAALVKPVSRNILGHLSGVPDPEWDEYSLNNGGPPRYDPALSSPFPIEETDETVSRVGGVCGAGQFPIPGTSHWPSKYTEGEGFFRSPEMVNHVPGGWNEISGDVLDATFEITAHHKGYIELSLCAKGDFGIGADQPPTMECFNANVLEVVDTEFSTDTLPNPDFPNRFNLPPACSLERTGPYNNGYTIRGSFKLPDLSTLDGSAGTMLRWRYVTSNSCVPPGTVGDGTQGEPRWTAAQWSEANAEYGATCNNGYDWFGLNIGMAVCGTQGAIAEEFINCADVTFQGDGFTPGRSEDPGGLKEPGQPPSSPPNDDIGSSVGSGYFETGVCADINADCTVSWFSAGHCNDPWWLGQCPVKCGACTPSDGNPDDVAATASPTASPTAPPTTSPTTSPTKNLRTSTPSRAKTSAPTEAPGGDVETGAPTSAPEAPVVAETGAPTKAPTAPTTLECVDYKTECQESWLSCDVPTWKGNCQAKCNNCPQDLPECADLTDNGVGAPCNGGDYVPATADWCSATKAHGWHYNNCRKSCCQYHGIV